MIALIVLGLLVVIAFWLMGSYNNLVALSNAFKNGFAQIDVQLQRRYELIPNLVECAKGYMSHERETLEAVLKARGAAQVANAKVVANPSNASAVAELSGAESVLTGAMGRMFALAEAYPDLKANATMGQLMEELSSTENKVSFARQAFNDSVMSYNTAREQFPTVLIANTFGFFAAEQLQITDPDQRTAPKVSFTK